MKVYDPTPDMKTRCPILFEMLSSNLRSDSIDLKDLRYVPGLYFVSSRMWQLSTYFEEGKV